MEWTDLIQRQPEALTSWLTFLDNQRVPLLDLLKTEPQDLSNDALLRRDASIRGQLKLLDKLERWVMLKDKDKSAKAYYDALTDQG